MTNANKDRFGFSEEYLMKVYKEHNSSKVLRSGCYVPTEEQVSSMAADELTGILIDWFWESPSELIPNNEQIGAVREILLSRPDQDQIKQAVAECDDYLST